MAAATPGNGPGFLGEFASRLRFPQLFFLTATLFLLDLFIPDFIPFVDEVLLGLLTLMLARLKKGTPDSAEADRPVMKNVTPPSAR